MPWTNRHVGIGGDIGRLLRVEGCPIYAPVDETGRSWPGPWGSFARSPCLPV